MDTSDGYCKPDTTGPLCALCARNYYYNSQDGKCDKCQGESTTSTMVIGITCATLFLAIVGVVACLKTHEKEAAKLIEMSQDEDEAERMSEEAKKIALDRAESFIADHSGLSKDFIDRLSRRN